MRQTSMCTDVAYGVWRLSHWDKGCTKYVSPSTTSEKWAVDIGPASVRLILKGYRMSEKPYFIYGSQRE